MKTLTIIGFLLYTIPALSQEKEKDSLIWVERTCETGLKKAKKDFAIGIYNSYSYGLLVKMEPKGLKAGFDGFYKKYMMKKYSMNIENRGCVINDDSICYSDEMEKLITKKFGKDIFKRGKKEAMKLFTRK
ncbi:hypothetical protein DMB65_10390 [Flavobacterium cheongpyeongense]|uniref:Uncharacterized protein n=1 Tax=Flavobacterium cheongpyeongense TaxID=2212651 RepID=A0A2V4BR01_9FLAO|nr:hypothetical protein [Flavobacterium cheongpyeongense]PXY40972.1 hypothetical protein DMB65_10390 [Flavobacterium cheongpyeongense]